jgi:fumarate reductase flavoprotein subunit
VNPEDAAAGADTEYGRTQFLTPLETAPFYAFKTYPTMFDNMGGLKINENAQVVDVWGEVIPRLYAAPMAAGGLNRATGHRYNQNHSQNGWF